MSEVLNDHPSTLIVGYGWVGKYIGAYFKDADYTDGELFYRVRDGELTHKKEEYDLGFVCVPTPPNPDGSCDTSIVEGVINKYNVNYWCIKSTVTVGTTEKIALKGHQVCMSPEFLGETIFHPLIKPVGDPFVILGGRKQVTNYFANAWALVTNSYAKIKQTDSKTAELTKLTVNTFLATKVTFMNEIYDIAKKDGIDWMELRECFLMDERIGRSHTYVYPNNRGFAGKCFPKDLNNLIHYSENKLNHRPILLETVNTINRYRRRKHPTYQTTK